jgi:NTP pyrophosphatase (non-canonical NTP hydrolase)
MNSLIAEAGHIIQETCHKASVAAGWWAPKFLSHNRMTYREEVRNETRFGKALVAEKLALIHSEISEALEGHRKNKMDDHLPHRKSIEVELADAIIRIGDLAGALQLDLGGAIEEKMAYNKVREDHKPEARNAEGGKAY